MTGKAKPHVNVGTIGMLGISRKVVQLAVLASSPNEVTSHGPSSEEIKSLTQELKAMESSFYPKESFRDFVARIGKNKKDRSWRKK